MTPQLKLLLVTLFTLAASQDDGYDPDWWTPDIVVRKSDPFDLIASDFGQPAGGYNWNADQFELMGRKKKTCNGCTANGRHVWIQDLTIFVNDEEFFVKAVSYNPVPLGYKSMDWDGSGGGGLCSERRTPYHKDEFKSACFDSDYANGGISDPEREPPGPPDGWFNDLWKRDFPIMKEAGANVVRLYNTNPTTRLYTEEVLAGTQTPIAGNIIPPALGNDHLPFMDAAQQAGLMVIFPLLGDRDLINTLPREQYVRYLNNQIDEVGNHPALLMYTVGNELDLEQDPVMAEKVNFYMDYARNYSLSKWGRFIPITHAVRDNPSTYNEVYALLHVDVFMANSGYRGVGFYQLWDGDYTNRGLGNLSRQYGIPNLIGEIGWHQVNNSDTKNYPGWFNMLWRDLINMGTINGCVGGTFFEYSDEPYSKNNEMEQSMGMVSMVVSSKDNPLPTDQQDFTFSRQTGITNPRTDPYVPPTFTRGNPKFPDVSPTSSSSFHSSSPTLPPDSSFSGTPTDSDQDTEPPIDTPSEGNGISPVAILTFLFISVHLLI